MKKSINIYGAIFRNAWSVTWEHKELWIIAALAGLANTGAIFHNVMRGFLRLQPADQISVEHVRELFAGVPWLVLYTRHLASLPAVRVIITLIAAAILLLAAALIITAAQHLLILGAHKRTHSKKRLNLRKLIHSLSHAHLWRLLAVNIIIYLVATIVIALGSLLLVPLLSASTLFNIISFAAVYALILPALFLVNIFGMFMLIQIVRNNQNMVQAFQSSVALVRGHWLVALESTLLLFVINALFSLLLLAILALYTIAPLLLLLAAYNTGSFILMVTVGVLGILGATMIFIFHAGIVTCFNYCVWTQLAHRLERYGLMPGLEGVVRWILHPAR